MVATVQFVRCVNCGGGGDTLTIIGLIVAAIGVLIAAAAYKVAMNSRQIAQDSLTAAQQSQRAAEDTLAIAKREHDEFMKQLAARARFEITARVVSGAPDGAFEIDRGVSMAMAKVEIGLTNTGAKAAGPTALNVLLPGRIRSFAGLTSGGERYGPDPVATSETLTMQDGTQAEAQWLNADIPRVSNRTPVLRWVWFSVEDRALTRIPLRVKAQSDDLPDDQAEVVLDSVIHVRWREA